MTRYKIYLVEDDRDITKLLKNNLEKYGFEVEGCKDFYNIVSEVEKLKPHLILLDVNLPAYDGFYWCPKIRLKTSCPILFISARNADADQVLAMSNGGDDYITKPFSFEVVLAKVNAHLRRAYGEYAKTASEELTCIDNIFAKDKLTLTCGDKVVELTKTEAGIVRVLFESFPKVSRRQILLCEIWDEDHFVDENTLNVTMSRVRKKLEQIDSKLMIKPVRGVGYRIEVKDDI